jgi:1,6-anhydro-N-acetylmuramate kinase
MTGTSIDGLDISLVRVIGSGLALRAAFIGGVSFAFPRALARELRVLCERGEMPGASGTETARLSLGLGEFHAASLESAWRELSEQYSVTAPSPDLICVHGQTVFHRPPLSCQLIEPGPIVDRMGVPVVFDLRAADLRAGGQGAPITPLADFMLFRDPDRSTAIVNLGGFCNITLLPACGGETEAHRLDAMSSIEGFDVCACNQLLDAISRQVLGQPYDTGGSHAQRGAVHRDALADLGAALRGQSGARRSLGTGDECLAWSSRWAASMTPEELCATACAGIGGAIAERLRGAARVLIAGGGARNTALVCAIAGGVSTRLQTTDAAGVPASFRESTAMAVLGALCQDGVAITLPRVTGCAAPAPVAGRWARL